MQRIALSSAVHESQQYLMLRPCPDPGGDMRRTPHHWVFLFQHAADRTPLLARTQIEITRTPLQNAEHSYTFSIVTASSRAALYVAEPEICTAKNYSAVRRWYSAIAFVRASLLLKPRESIAKTVRPDSRVFRPTSFGEIFRKCAAAARATSQVWTL